MDIFSLDIGGAFIKWTFLPAKGRPRFGIVPFGMNRFPKKLASVLKMLKPKIKGFETAVTMTGELADSFTTRADGVRHIVRSAVEVYGSSLKVFGRKGGLFTPAGAIKFHEEIASANWAIPPFWLGRFADDFLFVDIGSTTTDLTPVRSGKIANRGWNDFERLANGELIYTGYLRTPVQTVVYSLNVNNREVPLSAESFAIMGDVYLALGAIKPLQYACPTPDGRGKTKSASLSRLARTLLSERKALGDEEILVMARQVAKTQLKRILEHIKKFRQKVVVTGTGAFMLDGAIKSGEIERHKLNGEKYIKRLDPSYALALLVREGITPAY